jgi:hypothetical protein
MNGGHENMTGPDWTSRNFGWRMSNLILSERTELDGKMISFQSVTWWFELDASNLELGWGAESKLVLEGWWVCSFACLL